MKILINISQKEDILVDFHPNRVGEVAKNFTSSGKARENLGFAPHTGLEEGLRKTWLWHSK